MKTAALRLFLATVFAFGGHAADPLPPAVRDAEAMRMEQHWKTIWPELLAGGAGKEHIGTKVRFRNDPFMVVAAGPPVMFKCRSGELIQVTEVPKKARADIATLRKPPTIVTVEGVITAIDESRKTVTIQATKVDVSW